MLNLRMAQNLKTAITFIEQGHIRVGPEIVTDPAFLVTRSTEDFVTWVESSKIKHVMNSMRSEMTLILLSKSPNTTGNLDFNQKWSRAAVHL